MSGYSNSPRPERLRRISSAKKIRPGYFFSSSSIEGISPIYLNDHPPYMCASYLRPILARGVGLCTFVLLQGLRSNRFARSMFVRVCVERHPLPKKIRLKCLEDAGSRLGQFCCRTAAGVYKDEKYKNKKAARTDAPNILTLRSSTLLDPVGKCREAKDFKG